MSIGSLAELDGFYSGRGRTVGMSCKIAHPDRQQVGEFGMTLDIVRKVFAIAVASLASPSWVALAMVLLTRVRTSTPPALEISTVLSVVQHRVHDVAELDGHGAVAAGQDAGWGIGGHRQRASGRTADESINAAPRPIHRRDAWP